MTQGFKYIYGPVPSWRLGSSLGIDLLSQKEKICSFDCIYCQLGKTTAHTIERKLFVSTDEIMQELKSVPLLKIDYLTFSGRGEPTLALNLGEAILALRKVRREPIAVITNSSLLTREDIKEELILADLVIAKLDAVSQGSYQQINQPAAALQFENMVQGLIAFRNAYQGRLALQIMFTEKNIFELDLFVSWLDLINPDEVQVNTPLRSCALAPLSQETIAKVIVHLTKNCRFFSKGKNRKMISVYDSRAPKEIVSISDADTLKRRGKI